MSAQDTGSGPTGQGTGTGKPGLIQRLGWKLFGQAAGKGKPRPGWVYSIPGLGGLGVLVTLVYVSQVGGGKRWIVFGTAMAIAGGGHPDAARQGRIHCVECPESGQSPAQ